MRKLLRFFIVPMIVLVTFASCKDDDQDEDKRNEEIFGAYFVNYGAYGSGGASVTKYNYETKELVNDYFKQQTGQELTSNIQYAYEYGDSIYMVGNSSDQLIVASNYFVQTKNGLSENLGNPRYCVAKDGKMYISCLGSNPDWYLMPDSYIAVMDIATRKITKTIAMAGGPEGLAIANGNLYVALNYKNSIGVISLSDYSVSYIETPAVSSYFLVDKNENLYVSLVSTYSYPSEDSGLGYINTKTNTLENKFLLNGISASYASIMSANVDFTKIYVLATSYDANWNLVGSAYTFDVATSTYSVFAENLSGVNGLVCNPDDNNVYIFGGESVSEDGYFSIYNEDGTFVQSLTCGISPYWVLFLD